MQKENKWDVKVISKENSRNFSSPCYSLFTTIFVWNKTSYKSLRIKNFLYLIAAYQLSKKPFYLFCFFYLPLLPLRKFLKHLSRKAEGNGPLKPWQPLHSTLFIRRCQLHPGSTGEIRMSKLFIIYSILNYIKLICLKEGFFYWFNFGPSSPVV